MNALVLSKADAAGSAPELKLERRPIPTPNESQLLIKVAASKLNPSDAINVKGMFPMTSYPRVPGRDYAGTVVAAPSCPELEGTHCFGTSGGMLGFAVDGAQAEYLLIDKSWYVAMPDTLSFQEAGTLGVVYSTALLMIKRAQLDDFSSSSSDQNVSALIIGESGNVGSAVRDILAATYPHIRVTAANRRDGGEMTLPSGSTFNIIFSTVPSTETLQASMDLLAKGGRLMYIATSRPVTGTLQIDALKFYRDDLALHGINSIGSGMAHVTQLLREVSALFASRKLTPLKKPITQISLEDGVATYKSFGTTKEDFVFVM